MRRGYFAGLFSLVISSLLIAILGCTTTRSVVQNMRPATPDPKKRVLVFPLLDHAGLGSERVEEMSADFLELLEESPGLLLYKSPKDLPWPLETTSPELGVMPHAELVKEAEDRAMNALITGVINPIDITTKETGIWPFSKSSRIYEISMVINVVDTISRTLLLTQLESEEVSVPLDEAQTKNEKEIIDQISKKPMTRILKRQASAVVRSLAEESWTAKILSVDGNAIKINAGKNQGLCMGQRFEVFARREPISARGGQSFLVLGKKIGEVRLTLVLEKHAFAVPVAEGPFLAGQVVRLRP